MLRRTLKRMISVMIAFIIFGFIDNFLMVIAGDQIDEAMKNWFNVTNTMLAAGLGNTFSDMIGILSGRFVERIVAIKLPPPAEGELTRGKIIFAEALGIVIGCLIGLFPLIWMS